MRNFVARRGLVLLFAMGLGSLLGAGALQAAAQKGGSRSEPRMLTGHVFTGDNQPVQKAVVYLKNTKTLSIKSYITDPDGSYHFPAIAPNVDYEIYACIEHA